MPRNHCKTCGNPLHTDDTLAGAALSWADCSHCEHFSLASLRSWSVFFFSESDSTPRALPISFSQGSVRKNSGQKILASCDKRSHVGSMPCASQSPQRERAFVHPLHSTWSESLRREWEWIKCFSVHQDELEVINRLAAIDGNGDYTGVKPQHRYTTCPPRHRHLDFFFIVITKF